MSARELWLFATLWSLREYPARHREWGWERKFEAIRQAGFDGVMSPPRPELARRGTLRYLAITSVRTCGAVRPVLAAAHDLGAEGIGVQLGVPGLPLAAALRLAERVHTEAARLRLPYAVETHRATFTELPEHLVALRAAFRRRVGAPLPVCLDFSHVALVRHLAPERIWPALTRLPGFLSATRQLHLRPANGHHAQLPVCSAAGPPTPEYRAWRDGFARPLLHRLATLRSAAPLLAVPELGHAAPSYGLSTHGDTWREVLHVTRDLRRIWRQAGGAPPAAARLTTPGSRPAGTAREARGSGA